MRSVLILFLAGSLHACSSGTEAPMPPKAAAPSEAKDDYVGKGTIYDTQFKALHDAKQLGQRMNEDAARLDEQVDPDLHTPEQ